MEGEKKEEKEFEVVGDLSELQPQEEKEKQGSNGTAATTNSKANGNYGFCFFLCFQSWY